MSSWFGCATYYCIYESCGKSITFTVGLFSAEEGRRDAFQLGIQLTWPHGAPRAPPRQPQSWLCSPSPYVATQQLANGGEAPLREMQAFFQSSQCYVLHTRSEVMCKLWWPVSEFLAVGSTSIEADLPHQVQFYFGKSQFWTPLAMQLIRNHACYKTIAKCAINSSKPKSLHVWFILWTKTGFPEKTNHYMLFFTP